MSEFILIFGVSTIVAVIIIMIRSLFIYRRKLNITEIKNCGCRTEKRGTCVTYFRCDACLKAMGGPPKPRAQSKYEGSTQQKMYKLNEYARELGLQGEIHIVMIDED